MGKCFRIRIRSLPPISKDGGLELSRPKLFPADLAPLGGHGYDARHTCLAEFDYSMRTVLATSDVAVLLLDFSVLCTGSLKLSPLSVFMKSLNNRNNSKKNNDETNKVDQEHAFASLPAVKSVGTPSTRFANILN